ncbi:type II secretion system F family protein [Streptomyces sp. NRRL S-87]|uniref:type II secretion system F family protein n=1 Tax=Streptomyces sp. NRRL S-87 TaxID=1463920 RepID=UPI00099D45E0|nr:type II secretion system F family protein [Streptomyces sp. NRRL S-87]
MTAEFVNSLGTLGEYAAFAAGGTALTGLLTARIRERGTRRRLERLLARGGGGGPSGEPAPVESGPGAPGAGRPVAFAARRPRGPWRAGRGRRLGGRWPPVGSARPGGGWWPGRGSGRRGGRSLAQEAEAQLPLAADLLAACLTAGAGPREAAEVVGESLGGPVGECLARAGAEVRLGGDPREAWGRLALIPGARPLAACLERAARTGAPAAELVSRLAAGLREERSRAAVARAQRAAVVITAPVGLCFLPAFLAVGVAPVVIGLASGLLASR